MLLFFNCESVNHHNRWCKFRVVETPTQSRVPGTFTIYTSYGLKPNLCWLRGIRLSWMQFGYRPLVQDFEIGYLSLLLIARSHFALVYNDGILSECRKSHNPPPSPKLRTEDKFCNVWAEAEGRSPAYGRCLRDLSRPLLIWASTLVDGGSLAIGKLRPDSKWWGYHHVELPSLRLFWPFRWKSRRWARGGRDTSRWIRPLQPLAIERRSH